MLPASGYVTARARAVATAASTAVPPSRKNVAAGLAGRLRNRNDHPLLAAQRLLLGVSLGRCFRGSQIRTQKDQNAPEAPRRRASLHARNPSATDFDRPLTACRQVETPEGMRGTRGKRSGGLANEAPVS